MVEIDAYDIQRKSVANRVADSDHEPDADIENDVAVADIRLDSTNEQESDGSELILEMKVGNSLLDLLPVEILAVIRYLIPRSCLLDIQPYYCSNSSVGKIKTKSHRISP